MRPLGVPSLAVGFVGRAAAAVVGALAIASLAACGCESKRALSAAGGEGGGAGGTGYAGSIGGAAPTEAGGDDAGGDAGGSALPPWPVTLRMINATRADVLLPDTFFETCGFSISVAAVGSAAPSHMISATSPDTWCDCARCGATGRRFCEVTDPLCDGPPTKVAPDDHIDFEWDGRIAVTRSAPPSDSGCLVNCDHWEIAAVPGDYVFTIETWSATLVAQATLPGASGIILLEAR